MAMSMQKSTEDVSKSLNSSNFPIKRQSTRHKKTDSQVPTLNLNKSIYCWPLIGCDYLTSIGSWMMARLEVLSVAW